MAWLSYKFIILMVAASMSCAPEGYNYNRPDVTFGLPNQSNQGGVPLQAGQIFQKTVSYSVSHEDYEYLKQQKSEQVQNEYVNKPAIQYQLNNQLDTIVANSILQADANRQTIVQNSETTAYDIQNSLPLLHLQTSNSESNGNIPPVLQLQPPLTTPNNYFHNTAQLNNIAVNTHSGVQQVINIPNGPSNVQGNSSPANIQIASGQNYPNNVEPLIATSGLQPLVNVNAPPNNIPSSQVNAPVITKHIYFHVPPPDVEQIHRIPVPPQIKKTYKILFIKLPAQTSSNIIQTQSRLRPVAPIEEKTLIYVLVKKPEEPQLIVPTEPKLSEHEVLFVKYKDNPITETEEVERVVEIPQRNTRVNSQTLQPGFVNGQW